MSGIVGILNLDGAPVDRDLLWQLTQSMTYRGPDEQQIWGDGNVGFGHTMLRATWESETEKQPPTRDNKVWLTADARIDGREDLISKLESKLSRSCFIPKPRQPNDAELILLAYEAWGDDCVNHLIGDFAFAIWDSRIQKLFCARDHFGVKPFFYARVANSFLFSNTLDCLRAHADVSDKLDEQFIGDFLLFDLCRYPTITAFSDVKRLAPAHRLSINQNQPHIKQYWSLKLHDTITYRRSEDYVDHFNSLLAQAVKDRLRTNSVGVFMSGGLDSTTIATSAYEELSKVSTPFDLRICTIVFDSLFRDSERRYAALVAQKLGTSIQYLVGDDYELYGGRGGPAHHPEPLHHPLNNISIDSCRILAQHSRVGLTGYGLDPALTPSHSHAIDLMRRLELLRLIKDVGWFVRQGNLPTIGLRGSLLKSIGLRKPLNCMPYPNWLNRTFETRMKLRDRWEEVDRERPPRTVRPEALQSLTSPYWAHRFECDDPGVTFTNCESRHPFFDLRLLAYLLALPAVPWCMGKELIRIGMRDRLPDEVRLRPKTVLGGDPVLELHKRQAKQWEDEFQISTKLANYVDKASVPQLNGLNESSQLWINLRPLSLGLWLREVAY
jgi:asparagine synthase (glutamine-hydrolysing)